MCGSVFFWACVGECVRAWWEVGDLQNGKMERGKEGKGKRREEEEEEEEERGKK